MKHPITPDIIRSVLRENGIKAPNDKTINEILQAVQDFIKTDPDTSYIPASSKKPLEDIVKIYTSKTFKKYLNALREAIDDQTLYELAWTTGSHAKALTSMKRILSDSNSVNLSAALLLKKESHRPPEQRRFALVAELAGIYESCTGEKPARPSSKGAGVYYGPFYNFVSGFMSELKPDLPASSIASDIDRVMRTLYHKKVPVGAPSKVIVINRIPSGKKSPQKTK